jgi:DNA-binding NarL/FixJ family response regulator
VSGYELCRWLRAEWGARLPIIFLSGERTESFDRVAGLLLGADDCMVKPFAPDELVARVCAALRRAAPPASARVSTLTPRETDILRLLADGLGQKEIAAALAISPRTVGTHVEHSSRSPGPQPRSGGRARPPGQPARHALLT